MPPAAPAIVTKPGLDTRMLALASLASVLGGVVASAFGGGPLATLISAAVSPWVTAFLIHPGPHRVRRVTAVLLFAFFVAGCRRAAAAVRTAARRPDKSARRRGDAPGSPDARISPPVNPGEAQLVGAWLAQVTLTAAISCAVAVMSLTAAEAIRGQAVAAERDKSFTVTVFDGTPPVITVPDTIEEYASENGKHVAYHVTATDDREGAVTASCDPPPGSFFSMGTTIVACIAKDSSANTAEKSFKVVLDEGYG